MTPAPGIVPGVTPGAAEGLSRRTLSAIPTIYGRLRYLANLRAEDNRYLHHGLAISFGADEVHNALRRSHMEWFRYWLHLNLEEQKADLDRHLASVEPGAAEARACTDPQCWRRLLPNAVRGSERKLFLAEADALIAVLRRGSDPGRSPDA